MRRSIAVFRIGLTLALVLLASYSSHGSPDDNAVRYRRIYAPLDRLADWPRGENMYKPMDAAAFERWAGGGTSQREMAQVTHADFSATLNEDGALSGEMALEVQSPVDQVVALPLEPCGIALTNLYWDRNNEKIPARLGSDAEGRLFLFVNGAGTLRGRWSFRGRTDQGGQLEFLLKIPPSITKTFVLDLPRGMEPDLPSAVVKPPTIVAGDSRRWILEVPGQSRLQLRIISESIDSSEGLNLIKQNQSFEFRIDQIQLEQELALNVYGTPLKQIALSVDDGIRVTEALLGDQPIEWSEQGEAEMSGKQIVLLLPEAVSGNDRIVRLRAIAEPVYEKMWKIPRIIPEGFSWQEGITTLLVADPLVVEQMVLSGCQQLRAGQVPGSNGSEIYEIQDHGPDAEVEIFLAVGDAEGQMEAATTYTFTDTMISGRMVCDLRVNGPAQFMIQGYTPEDWNIESVRASEEGVIERWRQEATDSGNRLQIDLRRGVSTARPLRLEVTGRINRPLANQLIELKTLQMLRIEGFRSERELVELIARDPFRVRVTRAADFQGVTFSELTAEEKNRVEEDFSAGSDSGLEVGKSADKEGDNPEIPPSAILPPRFWYDRSGMQQMKIRIEKPTPRLSAEIRIDAQVEDGSIGEQYVLEITPQDSGIDALQIAFSRDRGLPIQCSVVDQNGVALDGVRASRLSQQEGSGGQVAENWLVRWNRPLSETFQLIINRTATFEDHVELSLVAVPRASEKRATVAVRSGLGNHFTVENRGLKVLPLEDDSYFVPNPMRGRFRYDPQRDVRVGSLKGVSLEQHDSTEGSTLIWRALVESWFAPSGEATHRATYYLESDGQSLFVASLGKENHFQAAEVDGVQVRMPSSDANLPLNLVVGENQRFSVVQLQWTTPFSSGWLPWIKQVPLPLPQINIPILSHDRIIHAPPGFVTTDSLSGVGADRVGLSWQQRLFGPLARTSATPLFDPFDSDTWDYVPVIAVDKTWRQRRTAEGVLKQIGSVLMSNPNAAAWGDFSVIKKLQGGENATDPLPISIDLDALAAVGIGPETPVQVYAGRSPRRVAIEALQKANLVVGLHAGGGLLSTVDALQPTDSAWLIEGVICQLQDEVNDITEEITLNQSTTPFALSQADAINEFPWKAIRREGFDNIEDRGGSTFYWNGSEAKLKSVQLVDVESLRGMQWTLFAVIVLAGCIWGPQNIRKGILWVLSLAVAALILPSMLAPLATAAFCAVAFAFLWKRFYPLSPVANSRSEFRGRFQTVDGDPITKSMRVTGSQVLMLLAGTTLGLVALNAVRSHAGTVQKNPPAVIIPIDKQNKIAGDTYYLSSSLFDAVHQDRSRQQGPMNWLLIDANYQIDYEWASDNHYMTADFCNAKLQIEVLGHHAIVTVPFGGNIKDDVIPRITVDGKVLEEKFRKGKDGFSFVLEEPGIYSVEIQIPLRTEEVGGVKRVDCPIPPLVTSQLEINYPADAVAPEVLSAEGKVIVDESRNRLQAELGNAGRLIVQWQEDELLGENGLTDVDQLTWLKIQPGAVVVDTRFRLDVEDRRIQRVRLLTDPKLRLLSPVRAFANGEAIELKHSRSVTEHPQQITLQWSPGISGELELRVPFLWTGVSGIGNIRTPDIQIEGSHDTRRWLAVSADPSLFVDRDAILQDASLRPLSDTAAGEIWGLSDRPPDFFYEQMGSIVDWSLPTRLQESETTGYAKLAIGVSDDQSEVYAEYELETTDGNRCQYQLEIPSAFVPTQVELRSDDVGRLMRWSVRPQPDSDRLTLFLAEPVRGPLKLIVRGHLLHSEQHVEVPRFVLQGVRMRGGQVSVYRQSAVQLELDEEDGNWEVFDKFVPLSETLNDFGHLMGVYRLAKDDLPQTIKMYSNKLDADAIQVVSLNRKKGRWEVEVDLRIRVDSGQLATLRFRIPKEFRGPFEVDPEIPVRVNDLPEGDGFVLDVRLPRAIEGSYRLLLRGDLNIAPEDPVRCPVISIEELDQLSQFVVLPKQVDFQDVSWKTTGLVPASLPEDTENAPLSDTSVSSFKVVNPTIYGAVLESVDQPAEEPVVKFAQIGVCNGNDDQYVYQSVFDIDPAGLATVGIEFSSAAADLLRVRINDRQANVEETMHGWKVELNSRNLLQRVEVLYSAPYALAKRNDRAVRPILKNDSGQAIPISETLWSFSDSVSFEVSPQDDAESLMEGGPEMQYTYYQQRAQHLIDALTGVTSAEPMEVLLPWYTRTMRQLLATEAKMEFLIRSMPAEFVKDCTAKQAVLAGRVFDVASRLVEQGVYPSMDAIEQIGLLEPSPWGVLFSGDRSIACGNSDEAAIFIERPTQRILAVRFRWLLAAILGGAIACIGWWPRASERLLCRSYPVIPLLFIIALFYWLFLSPSVLGFAAMLLVVLLAMVAPWIWAIGEISQTAVARSGEQKR
ncbi:MAG: hypothetical protein VXZ84_09165 [Planctomycetota bacterium]|nr:hypothetical protein [Planctomycetota bacterium]